MILIIDNYDSFTYNLYQYAGEINPNIIVYRNDKITIEEIRKLNPSHIIISPGPGYPKDAGICIELIKELYKEYPILGICLGHQAICEAFGGIITHSPNGVVHGKQALVQVDNETLIFKGLEKNIIVGRYHSLAVQNESLPNSLEITAKTEDDIIMGVKVIGYNTYGIQFHPESILTADGKKIIDNFLKIKGAKQ